MVYFIIGFLVGGCAGVILTGLIANRKEENDE